MFLLSSPRHKPEPWGSVILGCGVLVPWSCHHCNKYLKLGAWPWNWVMAMTGNGHLVTQPRLPPRAGCRNMEAIGDLGDVSEESRV